jgi:FtsP/CotA-like multicopper oxidase with cupredoxin domain
MNQTRRNFLQRAAILSAGVLAGRDSARARELPPHLHPNLASAEAEAFLPVVTPDVPDLSFEMENGVKVFHLIAEPVKQEIFPGRIVNLWGYNGSAPGPTIQVNQGDRVRIMVHNHLPEPTSMHWHGFEIPFDMDGSAGLSQDAIPPGGHFVYEFTINQEGTYFYHSHMAMQEMMGMIGAFIMHPKISYDPVVQKDFAIILQEYAILPNNPTPNSMNMEYNWLTFNGKSAPATTPLIVRLGDRVRLRLINLGMDHHPVHLHGHQFVITGTEGGRQPKTTWGPNNTVLVGVAQSRTIEFDANNPGDWMIHCHLPHHMMNQMSSMVGPMSRRRGMGVGSTMENPAANGPLSPKNSENEMESMPAMAGMQMNMDKAEVSDDANSVPGFPQDAYMEGPVMAMDRMFDKPEHHGLRPGWTGFMQGMMALIRVLPPQQYEQIVELRKNQGDRKSNAMPTMHDHMHE